MRLMQQVKGIQETYISEINTKYAIHMSKKVHAIIIWRLIIILKFIVSTLTFLLVIFLSVMIAVFKKNTA